MFKAEKADGLCCFLIKQRVSQQPSMVEVEMLRICRDRIRGVIGGLEEVGLTKFQRQTSEQISGPAELSNRQLEAGRLKSGGPEKVGGKREHKRRERGRR